MDMSSHSLLAGRSGFALQTQACLDLRMAKVTTHVLASLVSDNSVSLILAKAAGIAANQFLLALSVEPLLADRALPNALPLSAFDSGHEIGQGDVFSRALHLAFPR